MAKLAVGFVQAIDVAEDISNALLSGLQKIINLVLVIVAVSDLACVLPQSKVYHRSGKLFNLNII